ncbi:MAG TPA: hypothetical protein VJ577_18530 [Burkholderiaceae bacterium]|nr:hypothetical protein [Burkholderiaceae bacterium]
MNTFKTVLIAAMCLGPISMAANAAGTESHKSSTGSNQSTLSIAPAANMNESYAKLAKEDLQLKKKRLENERDAALTRCENETGNAKANCRKQANADFNRKVKREQLAYEETLRRGASSGSSSGGSHASGKSQSSNDRHGSTQASPNAGNGQSPK